MCRWRLRDSHRLQSFKSRIECFYQIDTSPKFIAISKLGGQVWRFSLGEDDLTVVIKQKTYSNTLGSISV